MDPYKIQAPAKKFVTKAPVEKPSDIELLKQEISSSETDVIRAFSPYGQNTTDPVVRAKGIKIYKEMSDDDQIKVCLDIRKHARLSSPWNIIPGKEGNAQSEMYADFIKHCLSRMEGAFEDNLYEIYSAIEFGYSISELIMMILTDGPYKGKIGLKAIKTREPYNYYFKTDAFGNLLGLVYIGLHANLGAINREANQTSMLGMGISSLSTTNPTPILSSPTGEEWGSLKNPFPPDKFVIYSYNSKFGNWYGNSDLLSAFRSWTSKKMIMRFWNVWLERYASPFTWAQYDPALGLRKEVIEEIDDFIKNLSSRSGIRVPKGVDINVAQSASGKAGGDAYKDAVEAHNRYISHAILFPNLLGFTGDQGSGGSGGTHALGKTHMDAFMWVLEKMGRDTSETIVGEQIIKRLIDLNFPGVDDTLMPRFKFEGVDEDSISTRATLIKLLGDGGFIDVNEEWIREFLTLPKKDEGIVLQRPAQGSGFGPGQNDPSQGKQPTAKLQQKDFSVREASNFEAKIQPEKFALRLDRLQQSFFDACSSDITDIRDKLLKDVERKKIIEDGDPKAVSTLVVNVGALKETMRAWLAKIYLDSKLQAFEEMGRGGVKIEVKKNFAADNAPMYPWNPLPPQEAVDFFNRKVLAYIYTDDGVKNLIQLASRAELAYYDTRAFAVSGIVRDDILNDAKQIILNGIKRNDVPGTVGDLKSMFNRYLDQGIAVDGELLQPSRLNTIVRTNMVEAINGGRRNMFTDPDVKGFVELWQYSAILDDRTTDYCRCMDQKVFRIEDMAGLEPPAHYNCRSLAVPITKYEVEDAKATGGIEISEPCIGRMMGFSERKDFYIGYDPIPMLGKTLDEINVACPYSKCHSSDTKEVARKFNVSEFHCNSCSLPFRVTDTGDIYLYDTGEEKWERSTRGLKPTYFSAVK